MKKFIPLLVIIISISVYPQGHFESFLKRITSVSGSDSRQAIADSFVTFARTKGIPFIENDTAVFLYRGTPNSAAIAGDFTDWNPTISMERIYPTNFFYYRKKFEMNARLDYKFVVTFPSSSQWILDPENSHTVSGGYGPNSELAMPDYVQPWEIQYRTSVQHGKLEQRQIFSSNTNINYKLNIYLPAGYNSSKTYPTVYFQDGAEYISLGSAVNVIDNLIDSLKINKVIAVFVTPNNRNEEYAGSIRNEYASFFAKELVPFIDSLYPTIKSPEMRLVLGDSYGGNISGIICYSYPNVFGNCGLHSAAFQPYNYEVIEKFLSSPKLNVKFSSIWGTYEPLWQPNRTFRDSLIAKGYSFQWLELPEGHSWGQWRASTDRILEYIFPYGITGIDENEIVVPKDCRLEQNYPNPFNSTTHIRFNISENSHVVIKLYDLLGRERALIVNEYFNAGSHDVSFSSDNLSSGTYFYSMTAGNYFETKKMIYLK